RERDAAAPGQGGKPPRQRQSDGGGRRQGGERRGGGTGGARPSAAPAPANSAMADALRRAGLTDPGQGGRKR
ncbi:hypothetical protein, partial [Streptomyces sp. NPDC002690]